jgi:hypothetical protein
MGAVSRAPWCLLASGVACMCCARARQSANLGSLCMERKSVHGRRVNEGSELLKPLEGQGSWYKAPGLKY